MRVRDLLRMATGHQTEPSMLVPADSSMRDASWVRRFFAHPVAFKPGTHFLYNSPATYMLSAIVQKTTGQTVLDYLTPRLFEPGLAPEVHVEPIMPGTKLPGGLVALYDGRGSTETPIWAPEQRAIVFADGMTANGGVLRVWDSPVRRQGILPALRAMLDLPFEHVLVSHGDPVHSRAEFEAALDREPWSPMDEE
jgi:CubicO group peptidase (beta-lactamase class C family)